MTESTKQKDCPTGPEKNYWLDNMKNVNKVYWAVVIVCTLLFIADALYHKHPYFSLENWFGFYGIFGFVACVGLVLAAKEIRKIIIRDEKFYEADKTKTGEEK